MQTNQFTTEELEYLAEMLYRRCNFVNGKRVWDSKQDRDLLKKIDNALTKARALHYKHD
mgnify:CR=1 FL=1